MGEHADGHDEFPNNARALVVQSPSSKIQNSGHATAQMRGLPIYFGVLDPNTHNDIHFYIYIYIVS